MQGRKPSWQAAMPKLQLMAMAHCEDDAQRYHELTTAHFTKDFDNRHVTRLRICCLQPSPTWREYGLRQLRFYTVEMPSAPSLAPTPTLSAAERELAATVVDHLVELSQMTHQIRQTISTAKASRCGPGMPRAPTRAPGERELAPYIVGEWSDELRLGRIGAPSPSRSHHHSRSAGATPVKPLDAALGPPAYV